MSSDNEVSNVNVRPPVERLALRIYEVANAVGLSRRAIERAIRARTFPKVDVHVGRCPLWRVETVKAWLEKGDR
jgi:predicted DNA-binding transcriptional regulator AlpA